MCNEKHTHISITLRFLSSDTSIFLCHCTITINNGSNSSFLPISVLFTRHLLFDTLDLINGIFYFINIIYFRSFAIIKRLIFLSFMGRNYFLTLILGILRGKDTAYENNVLLIHMLCINMLTGCFLSFYIHVQRKVNNLSLNNNNSTVCQIEM